MDERVQRRIQRYGWDHAAARYEALWQSQFAPTHRRLRSLAAAAPGEVILDVACGTGVTALQLASDVGVDGRVVGIDLSERMVALASEKARSERVENARFLRMDAERLAFPDQSFDTVVCAFGMMYLPQADQAMREMMRVLKPGGGLHVAVWGERSNCAWAAIFDIVAAEVTTDLCPLFFRLGSATNLSDALREAGCCNLTATRHREALIYPSSEEACDAACAGGPVAMAWSRFSPATRARVRCRYLDAIRAWQHGDEVRLPAEIVMASGYKPDQNAMA